MALPCHNIDEGKVTFLNKVKSLVVCLDSLNNATTLSLNKYDEVKDFEISFKKLSTVCHAGYILITKENIIDVETGIKTYSYQISHKYVIVNDTDVQIKVFQTNSKLWPLEVKAKSNLPFHWTDCDSSISIFLSIADTFFTERFAIDELGLIVEQLILPNKEPADILRIERYIDKGVKYIRIMKELKNIPFYVIQNESSYITIRYKEDNSNNWKCLEPNNRVPFGWLHPQKSHIISLQFLWGRKRPIMIDEKEYKFSMDLIKRHPRIDLDVNGLGYKKYVWVALEANNDSKILRIRDMIKDYNPYNLRTITISLHNVGISLISSYLNKRMEILFMALEDVMFSMKREESETKIEFTISNMQVDNQMKRDPIFPVVISKAQEDVDKHFVRVCASSSLLVDPRKSFYSFEMIKVDVASFLMKVEEDLVIAVVDFFNNLMQSNNSNQYKTDLHEIIISIESLEISRIKCNMSFRSSMDIKKSNSLIAKSLAAAFLNIKELPVILKNTSFTDVYGKADTILLMLFQCYQAAIKSKRMKIIGGVFLSPFADASQIGIGITSFINNTEGPPKGIMERTGNLVKGAVAGTFGTVSGVTSTVSQGILALSADEDYILQKQKADEKHKPQNVMQGIGIGLVSTFKSFGSGMTGIITKPIEGITKAGMKGLFKVFFWCYSLGSRKRISWSCN